MSWRQFIVELGDLDAGAVEEFLVGRGALAVTFSDAADDPVLEPLPGETPLWRRTLVTGLFPGDVDLSLLPPALAESLGLDASPTWRAETLGERNWEREWLRDFRPLKFGRRLWVCPVAAPAAADDAIAIRLDPGLAFGTGSHPTTALCLERLEAIFEPTSAIEKRVLDFGCGSGILAIAAVLLGAREAVAVDIDPQAVRATRNNAETNAVADRIYVTLADTDPGGDYDVVVANILAKPLIELAEDLSSRLAERGRLILSGLLTGQVDAVTAAYRDHVRFDEPIVADGWACLTGRRA